MKPFNIKEHLEHPDWKVVTREGEPVRILYTELNDSDYPVVAVISNWYPQKYTAGGLFQASKETKYDLFFAPERQQHEGWVNITRSGADYEAFCGKIYASQLEAGIDADDCTLATVKIKWEE